MAAAKNLPRYLAGMTIFAATPKQGNFNLKAFSDANCGNNPENGKSTSLYVMRMQGLTVQSTMEIEPVATTLMMKDSVFYSSMIKELGFGTFRQRPYAHRQHIGSKRCRQPDLHLGGKVFGYDVLSNRELAKEGRINIHYTGSPVEQEIPC